MATAHTVAFSEALVIIPTRNRASLAINAIRSVLNQPDRSIRILVSDNSTDPEATSRLAQFCHQCEDTRLDYMATPAPMPMTQHWEWAIQQAFQRYDASHFIYLTDRMILKSFELSNVIRVATRYPNHIISYNHDRVVDFAHPVSLEQQPWTGKLYAMSSERLLFLSSLVLYHHCLPRMLNCMVPRCHLDAIRQHFGSVFSSVAPDFNFCYRSLDITDSILYYDKAAIIHYALDRSNGESFARGVISKDSADFLANLGGQQIAYAAPIPGLGTLTNTIVHEYCIVRAEAGNAKFPPIDHDAYLNALAKDIERIEDPNAKEKMQAQLIVNGWKGSLGKDGARPSRLKKIALISKQLYSKRASLLPKIERSLASAWTKPYWLFIARHFRVGPPEHNRFEFWSTAEALDYAERYPRRQSQKTAHLEGVGWIWSEDKWQ